MAPPSPSAKRRRYRNVGVQTGTIFPFHTSASCDIGPEFQAGGVDPPNDSDVTDATSSKQDRSSETIQDKNTPTPGSGSQALQPPPFVTSRLFSLPPYLTDEALHLRLKAEGVVDDRDEEVPERRVVSISGSGAWQGTRELHADPAPLAAGRSCSAGQFREDEGEDEASTSFHSAATNTTVIIHEDVSEQQEVEGPPGAPTSVDRSSGSTPESVIIITAKDSDLVHPGSFLRSRAPTPAAVQAPGRSPGLSQLTLPPDASITSHHLRPPQSGFKEDGDATSDSDGWTTNAGSPPRPIPALHGPSSLPYARCPSGAEGEVFYNSQQVRDLVWDVESRSGNRDPPYLHPDYVAVVEYQEQCSTKEESEVIVLVDSSLPTQRGHIKARSRSNIPLLPTNTNAQPAPAAETRRANEWRARPNRPQASSRTYREQRPLDTAEASQQSFIPSAPATLPASNSDSSVGSGNTAPYPISIVGEDLVAQAMQQPFIVDPQLSSDELRHYFLEKEQRRLYASEYQQVELDERFRHMHLGEDSSKRHDYQNPMAAAQVPLTMQHLNLYRNLLLSLEQNQVSAWATNDPLYSNHINPAFPGGFGMPISIPPPPSLSNERTEDTHPPSSVLPSPMAPYVPETEGCNYSSDIALYPASHTFNDGDQRGFSTGYLFPLGSLGYSRPPPGDSKVAPPAVVQMQNRWEERPNSSLPPSKIHYGDPDTVMTDDQHYDGSSFMTSPALDRLGQTHDQPLDLGRMGMLNNHINPVRPSGTPRHRMRTEATTVRVNDLDIPEDEPTTVFDFPRARANTLSALSATRGHRTYSARSLDLGREFIGPDKGIATTPSSSRAALLSKNLVSPAGSERSKHWSPGAQSSASLSDIARRFRSKRAPMVPSAEAVGRGQEPSIHSGLLQSALPVVEEKAHDQFPTIRRPNVELANQQPRNRGDGDLWHW